MSLPNWLPLVAAISLPLAAAAASDDSHRLPDPADAGASIPALRYQSAFQHYQTATDEPQSPDAVWVQVNAELNDQRHEQGGSANARAGATNAGGTPHTQHQQQQQDAAHQGHHEHAHHAEGH